MSTDVISKKDNLLFLFLGSFFVANALVAEFIGVKIFSLEKVMGLAPANLTIFGQSNLSFNLTAGVLLWPVVFVMTDVINEYYGRRGVRLLSYTAAVLIAYAFFMFYFAIKLPASDFWKIREIPEGTIDMDLAFNSVFGQGLWIIIGSLTAFLLGQIVDANIFHRLKKLTGGKMIWLRATGSTLVSQFIDSFVVLFIAFYIGAGMDLIVILALGVVNYIYKFIMAIVLTPLIYFFHFLIDTYLGSEVAEKMKNAAVSDSLKDKP